MKQHGLLLSRRVKQPGVSRRHEGSVAVATSNTRWCSDGFEVNCDDDDKLRVTFALDCYDREVMSWVGGTAGYRSDDVQNVMLEAVEKRLGLDTPSVPIEWLSENGSAYTAEATRTFARMLGLEPVTTPVRSPQSNGMAESLVRTIKQGYVAHMPKPDAATATALRNLGIAFEHYNKHHPHSALKYRSPREFQTIGGNINLRVGWCPEIQGQIHLGIAKHVDPLTETQIGRDDQRSLLIQLADQEEQQGPARLGERR